MIVGIGYPLCLYKQESFQFVFLHFLIYLYIQQYLIFMQADSAPQPHYPRPQKPNLQQQRQQLTPQQSILSQDSDLASLQSEDEQTATVQHYAKLKEVDKSKQQQKIQTIYEERTNKNEIQYRKINQRFHEEEEYVSLEHRVDKKYLILLSELRRVQSMNIYSIAGLKNGQIRLSSNEGKITVYTKTKQQGYSAIELISNYIDKLSLLKIQIKGEAARRLTSFRKLKKRMLQDKVVIFDISNKQNRQVYIGGEMKMSQLKLNSQKIKQYKIASFFLPRIKNKRSYKIIVNQFIKIKGFQESLSKSNIMLSEVERENQGRDLKMIIAHNSKKQVTNVEFDKIYMKQFSNYYAITFILSTEKNEKYLQQLTCENVSFVYLRQRKFPRTYLFIISQIKNFTQKIKFIQQQVSKIAEKIIGVRFLYFLTPDQRYFNFDEDKYYSVGFPEQKPYSIAFFSKRRQGKVFEWRQFLYSVIKCQNKQ